VDNGLTPKLQWRVARVVDSTPETESARTIGLVAAGWGGHLAGQHVDVKLTAEDGYSAQRSYSLGRPADGQLIELTVQQVDNGEVSPYLMELSPGDEIELRGPIGGWFVWRPTVKAPVLLVAGGSGIVPLMAMVRQRILTGSAEFRLVYSVRRPCDVYYAKELVQLERDCDWLQVALIYTRVAAPATTRPARRIDGDDLSVPGWTSDDGLHIYICGPTGFVESVTTTLIRQGHSPSTIRTERFGPSG
jgi:ferredoxin-NADP reductase